MLELIVGAAIVGVIVYFGGAYLGYWKAPYVTPRD